MDCSCRRRGVCRLRARSASRDDTCDDDDARAGTCRGTRTCTRGGTRACATFTNEDCAPDSTRTDHKAVVRRVAGVEGLLQDRVTRQLPARLRKMAGMFSPEKRRLRDSSAGDRIQSVHEPERSARPRGKKCSRATVRSGAGDRKSGDTRHPRGQLRERHLSKAPHIVSTAAFGRSAVTLTPGEVRRVKGRSGISAAVYTAPAPNRFKDFWRD
jgi:hypothetical protein